MELTVAPGTVTDDFRADVAAFYGDILGWEVKQIEVLGGLQLYLSPDPGQFLLVVEHERHLSSPGYDHLGLLCDTRAEVDALLDGIDTYAQKDDRVRVKRYTDLVTGNVVVHAFYVKYLLPIWFDVQVIERTGGPAPERQWSYS
jgi:hypothetical protein